MAEVDLYANKSKNTDIALAWSSIFNKVNVQRNETK